MYRMQQVSIRASAERLAKENQVFETFAKRRKTLNRRDLCESGKPLSTRWRITGKFDILLKHNLTIRYDGDVLKMGGAFSTLRRVKANDYGKLQQDETAESSPKKRVTSETSLETSVIESDSFCGEDTSKMTTEASGAKEKNGESGLNMKRTKTQEGMADTIDQAPFPSSPPMPRDSDKIKLDGKTGSPDGKPRTIYVSGDDREPELDEIELEVDHFSSVGNIGAPRSDTPVMVVREPVIQHPFPQTREDEGIRGEESITVVVNVESRHKGKRRRSTHSFTSVGNEPIAEIKHHACSEITDEEAEETCQAVEKDTKEEDLIEVKVDFYRRKRRRNYSSPGCGYMSLQHSEC